MKLSDYISFFLSEQGIRHVFVVTGGAAAHIIDSLEKNPNIDYFCTQHEQGAAMAADAYSRVTGNLGAAVATSGPGATNLITGVCCAYYDSIPVIYITGQTATFRLKKDTGIRQLGFQETDTVEIYKPITKYATRIDDPKRIRYELEKATYIARSGRPGPVLIDVPDNIQREEIEPKELESFIPEPIKKAPSILNEQVNRCIQLFEKAKRPVIILGWGVSLAKAQKEAAEFVEKMGFPVLPSWAMMYLFPSDNPHVVGSFGLHGTRYGNFTIQNADLVLSIGSRLDTHLTGSPITSFARGAKKIVVDIDNSELNKFKVLGMDMDLLIHSDAKEFLQVINTKINKMTKEDISDWNEIISEWKRKYPICPPEYYLQEDVNPYVFVKALSKKLSEGDVLIVDTGCALAWIMQSFEFKQNQLLLHDFNNTSMGYALPASIGACLALGRKQIICIIGDGSLQMSVQELATVAGHELPIKIFLINNHGYSMIRQTQDQWLGSRYLASSKEGGLTFPDFVKVAEAYNFKTLSIHSNNELDSRIQQVLDSTGPFLCNIEINPNQRVIPQTKFGRPIEDTEPLLDRKEFMDNMFVKP